MKTRSYTYYSTPNSHKGLVCTETVYDVATSGAERDMVTTYTYDFTGGEQTATATTEGRDRVSHYNAMGQLVYEIDEYDRRTDYAYDWQGRLTVTKFPAVVYDGEGENDRKTVENHYNCCYLEWTKDENGNKTYYDYDGMGRVTEQWTDVQMSGGNKLGNLVEYTYNGPFGARDTVKTYVLSGGNPVARTTTYQYDTMGRVRKIVYPYQSQEGDLLGSEEFLYDDTGRLAAKKDGNGDITAYEYDDFDRVSEVDYDYTGGFSLPVNITSPDVTYTYQDAKSLVLSASETIDGSQVSSSYTYDRLGRMKTYVPPVPANYGTITYTWNTLGQKTSMTVPQGYGNKGWRMDYSYDRSARQTGMETVPVTVTSGTTLPGSAGAGNTRMFYDAGENRVKLINKTGSVYYFVYDPTASVPAVVYEQGPYYRHVNMRDADGSLVSRQKYYGGTRLAWHTYHFDGLGSTVALSDVNGNVTDRYSYDAWGNATHTYGSTSDNPYQFVGQLGYYTHYQDPGPKLLQLGVRFYDPETGRFTQRDPLGWGLNCYSYVEGKPMRLVDPLGLKGSHYDSYSCPDLKKAIEDRANELQKRWNDMWDDLHALYDLFCLDPSAVEPGIGSWLGHRKQYLDKQKNLNKMLDSWRHKKCECKGFRLGEQSYNWAKQGPPATNAYHAGSKPCRPYPQGMSSVRQ